MKIANFLTHVAYLTDKDSINPLICGNPKGQKVFRYPLKPNSVSRVDVLLITRMIIPEAYCCLSLCSLLVVLSADM